MSKYVRTIVVGGFNGMVGKLIPFGYVGTVVEECPNGNFVDFEGLEDRVWVPHEYGQPYERCHSCEQLRINGVVTHEAGCPDAYKDEIRECSWCGQPFFAAERHQKCCSHSCQVAYSGVDCNCDECSAERNSLEQAAELDGAYHGE